MRTDQRRNEDLTRLKSVGGHFVCAAELKYIIYIYIYVARTDIDFHEVHPTLLRSLVCAYICLSTPNCSEIFQLKPSFEL